jgi:hypothetical protein
MEQLRFRFGFQKKSNEEIVVMKDGESCSAGKECCDMDTMKKKAPIVAGVFVILTCLLGMLVHPVLHWLTLIVGGAMVYTGYTGNCAITGMLAKHCPLTKTILKCCPLAGDKPGDADSKAV